MQQKSIVKFIVSLCFFIQIGCFAQPATTAASTTTNDPSNTVNQLISTFMTNQNIPGVAVALFYNNKPYFYNYGVMSLASKQPVTSNTIFEIGSVTKVFTATLLAEQLQAGKMSLQNPVTQYLPATVKSSKGAINQVTLQELATHTSGLPSVPPGVTLRGRASYSQNDLMSFVAQWQPDAPVGTQYSYSNIGFGLLGYALENATGQSYTQLVQNNIFNPLNMKSSSVGTAVDNSRYAQGYNMIGNPAMNWPTNAWPAAGAIRSTASDMQKFLQANLGIATSNTPQQLIKAMTYAQKSLYQGQNINQGMAWVIRPNGIITKGGATAGFSSFIAIMPGKQMGIVILTNKTGTHLGNVANQILLQLSQ